MRERGRSFPFPRKGVWGWRSEIVPGKARKPVSRPRTRPTPATDAYRALAARYARYREGHGYRAASVLIDERAVEEFLAWLEGRGVIAIERVTAAQVAEYWRYVRTRPKYRYTKKHGGGTLAPSTAGSQVAAVRGVLAMLHHAGELARDPASGLDGGRADAGERVGRPALTQAEVRALYAASESQAERAVLSLGYGCGLRIAEAVALGVSSATLYGGGAGSVTVERGKGGRRRTVPLSAGVRDDLADYYHGERAALEASSGTVRAALMLNARGRRMQTRSFRRILGALVARAIARGSLTAEVHGKRTSFHDLRHAIATHLLERGLTLEQVRRFLGHRNLETTEVYTHVSRALLDELVRP